MEINSFEDILKYCREMKATIPEVMIEYEIRKTGRTREQIIEGVRKILNVMIESVNNGLTRDVKSPSGLLNNFAKKVYNAKVN